LYQAREDPLARKTLLKFISLLFLFFLSFSKESTRFTTFNMTRQISTTKLIILALLGLCAIILGGAVLTLQMQVLTLQQQVQTTKHHQTGTKKKNMNNKKRSSSSYGDDDDGTNSVRRTVQSSRPTQIRLSNAYPPPDPTSFKTVAEAYWNQALYAMKDWNIVSYANSPPLLSSTYTSNNNNGTSAIFALQQAARAGHPEAQYYLANAMASGIWPVDDDDGNNDDDHSHHSHTTTTHRLHVTDEWISTVPHRQLQESYLNWHMAAMGGHVEAAMALAFRKGESSTSSTTNSLATCRDSLPYYEAAAHGIMDTLEADRHSRAKVIPSMDKHVLAQVHIHGGTSSQLDWNNKPDESDEALQFYHLKATTSWKNPPSRKVAAESTSSNTATNIDVHAAYTLGHLYQYGIRGVQQNLTLSLLYYEIAAAHSHWESAGQAGTMYFWGMGVEQDVEVAWEYFRIGAPFALEGCRRKHDYAIKQQQNNNNAASGNSNDGDYETSVVECDETSVNGLGLIYLFGIEGKLKVDLAEAEKYFVLAKEMGNTDALYNLAMIWMGWKTHFKNVEDLEDDGMSVVSNDPFGTEIPDTNKAAADDKGAGGAKKAAGKPPLDYALHQSRTTGNTFKGPLQSDLTDGMKLLQVAASRGHLQAKHRLGMIYSQGVRLQTAALTFDAIKPDCIKAKNFYQWIVDNAAPTRSKRLRKAYKDYVAGDLESSLRNYLAAAETGSSVGQLNAAFLLERGTCLGLSPTDCATASVRLWKAASARGNAEACLRVGDFYYYGRLRSTELPVGPFAWVQYVLYPEEHMPKVLLISWNKLQEYLAKRRGDGGGDDDRAIQNDAEKTCSAGDGECRANENDGNADEEDEELDHEKELVDSDLAMAAHYYTVAVERYSSPRANFNLGFMHEWGLGIAQDFPLAKRHYDLASSGHTKEAELAVQIALTLMNTHELFVKWHVAALEWWEGKENDSPETSGNVPAPMKGAAAEVGAPTPGRAMPDKTEMDVILSHLFNWSSFAVFVLFYIMFVINQMRRRRRG
jgi:TPR repeat protein